MEDQCPVHQRMYQDFDSGLHVMGPAIYVGMARDPCGKGPDNTDLYIGLDGGQKTAYELCRDANKMKLVLKVAKNGVFMRP